MRDVDQHTGKDLLPLKKSSEDDALRTNPSFSKDGLVTRTGLSGIRIVEEDDVGPSRRPLKRMSSLEKREAKQLIASRRSRYSVDMSPVKILKNLEGALGHAAALQSALIKEHREVHEQQQRTMLDSIPKDLNRPWEDPMPKTGERNLAQELRGVGLSAYDMPEWKNDAFGKTISFGQR
ncbi:hypothetical protein CerSpe_039600 [Prunus speciosa]